MVEFDLNGNGFRRTGAIPYEDLVNLITIFYIVAKAHGAISCQLADGYIVATKGSFSVSLSIWDDVETHLPLSNYFAFIEDAMTNCLG